MAEYIDRETALWFVFGACAECKDACEEIDGIYADCNQCMLEGVKLKLRDLPAADVRPVVLCRDCKFTKTDGAEDPAIYCKKWDRWEMPPDGFCWLGKKRKETTNEN